MHSFKVLFSNQGHFCKAFNICIIKLLGLNVNDILGKINFGIQHISWLQIINKICCLFLTTYLTFYQIYIVASIRTSQILIKYSMLSVSLFKLQSTLIISTSVISNNRLSRRENLILVLTQKANIR